MANANNISLKNLSVTEPDELSIEWEANVMCILTRMDQMGEIEFYCRDYQYNPEWKTKLVNNFFKVFFLLEVFNYHLTNMLFQIQL